MQDIMEDMKPPKGAKKIWFNGKLISWEKATVHVFTHALHYGDGVFEGIRCYGTERGPMVFRLREHVKRLFRSADLIGLEISYSQKEIERAILRTIKGNNLKECYIRPIAFRGYGKMGLNPGTVPVDVAILALPWGKYLGGDPLRVLPSPFIRIHPKSLHVESKACGHYVNPILATVDANKKGYDEALMFDWQGYVAEGSGENIFFAKKGKLFTPKRGAIFPGITRDTIFSLAKDRGLSVKEKRIQKKELLSADEVFFTGTGVEVTPVVQIGKKRISGGKEGPITFLLRREYERAVRGELSRHKSWFTKVS